MATRAATKILLIPARMVMMMLGCMAVAWGAIAAPAFWQQTSTARTAEHIIGGDLFKTEALLELTPNIEAAEQAVACQPIALRDAAIIRLRMAEDVVAAGERNLIDRYRDSLRASVGRSLACSPADPLLWLSLYWLENARGGFRPYHLRFLRMSYRLGANEGWIAVMRNRLALSVYERLSPDLQEVAVAEFRKLVDSAFYNEAASVLTGPGWPLRDILMPRLKDIDLRHREFFAKLLYFQGYDVDMPGVARPVPRPWR